jgi:hypothetical protein
LKEPELFGEEWWPAKSKIVVRVGGDEGSGPMIVFIVDPGFPGRWKEEPWHSLIRKIATRGIPGHWQTRVRQDGRAWLCLPDREVEVDETQRNGWIVEEDGRWDYLQFKSKAEAEEFGEIVRGRGMSIVEMKALQAELVARVEA